MHLPEIADKLMSSGYVVKIDRSHRRIVVSLKNRNVTISEIERALHWDINHAVRFARSGGSVVITE